jgi:hypothetical protein
MELKIGAKVQKNEPLSGRVEDCLLKKKFLFGGFESFYKNGFDGIALRRVFN